MPDRHYPAVSAWINDHHLGNSTGLLSRPKVSCPGATGLTGRGRAALAVLSWLAHRRLIYWGDILDRLRQHFPNADSLLMDRAMLLAHESQWVTEPKPAVVRLDGLRPEEADLYRDLVEDSLGRSLRLEQERISYATTQRAVTGT